MACNVLGTEDSEAPGKSYLSWDSKVREKFPHEEAAGGGGRPPQGSRRSPTCPEAVTFSVL